MTRVGRGTGAQPGLPGLAVPVATDRLFFALFPDADAVARIGGLARMLGDRHGLRGRAVPPGHLHVTLHFLGDHAGIPAGLHAAAIAAAGRVAMPAFDVCFDRAGSFAGGRRGRPCVLRTSDDAAPVAALHRQLGDALRAEGLGRHVESRFVPHLTLLYDERAVPMQAIGPVAWRARSFVLVCSTVGKPVYRRIGEWALAD